MLKLFLCMKKGCLVIFVLLIAIFLICGSGADKDMDYKMILIKESNVPLETSAVLNDGKVSIESSQSDEENKEELKEQLRSLGYLD